MGGGGRVGINVIANKTSYEFMNRDVAAMFLIKQLQKKYPATHLVIHTQTHTVCSRKCIANVLVRYSTCNLPLTTQIGIFVLSVE